MGGWEGKRSEDEIGGYLFSFYLFKRHVFVFLTLVMAALEAHRSCLTITLPGLESNCVG